MRLKILTYNIHKGFNWSNTELTIHRLKEAIQSTGADLVFLQEVVGENLRHAKKHENWPEASQFEFLADQVWSHYAYARNAVYTHGEHGNAILSKYPITWWEHQDISTNELEQRGLLHCTVDAEGLNLHAVCLHLNLMERGRRIQYERIRRRIENHVRFEEPLIVAGDFNDWNRQASPVFEGELGMRESHKAVHGRYAKTFPVWLPVLRVDRIYVRGFRILEAETFSDAHWRKISDHCALTALLETA